MSDFAVTTNKADYQPGETALFSASSVETGGTVGFSVAHVNTGADGIYGTEDDLYTYDLTGTGITWTVTDGGEGDSDGLANGIVTTTWYVNLDAANETFLLSATDTASGETATTTFTDADPVPAVLNNVANGLLVLTGNDPHGTGTGTFPAFVQIQGDGEDGGTDYDNDDDSGTEEGFNTSWRENGSPDSPVLDTDNSLQHNHNLVLLEVPLVEIDDVLYREFRLDLGEGGGDARAITLDALKLYWSPNGSEPDLDGLNEIYNMDGGLDGVTGGGDDDLSASILLSGWQSGQGASDYKFYIPEDYFTAAGVDPSDYIYLYSAFSNANSEFEEWSVADTGLANPDINIDKVTTEVDENETGDGITVQVDDDLIWTYTITNTGNVGLSNLVVTDDVLGTLYQNNAPTLLVDSFTGDTNNNDILEVSETWVFTINGTATAGSYSNIGSVTGEFLDEEVSDSDPSSYTGQGGGGDFAAIKIEKVTLDGTTNATDVAADFGSGSDSDTILVGETVTWIYKVTNAGSLALGTVAVVDNLVGAAAYLSGDVNDNDILETTETWYFTATGLAVADDYENIGTASGTPNGGVEVTDNDGSGYFGADPSLTIEKSIVCDDGETEHDADTAITLLVDDDGKVTYKIVVTNTGNVDLTDVSVSDPSLTLGNPVLTDDPDGFLDTTLSVGETWTYTVDATWVVGGPHTNTATADAKYTDTALHVWEAGDGDGVSESASYFGAAPAIDVKKFVSVDGGNTWLDADAAPGPVLTDISPYDPMFKFVVHNTGNVALTDILLHDSLYDLNGSGTLGTDITIASLAADDNAVGGADTHTLTITVPWAAGQHTNTATASATFEDDCEDTKDVSDTDDANYLGFDVGVLGLTKGFWGQHQEAWDVTIALKKGQADTQALVNSQVLKYTDIFNPAKLLAGGLGGVDANGDGAVTGSEIGVYGVLLGDANGDFLTNNGENTLFVSLAAARQIIQSSDSANDTRQILMSQAVAAQLNVYNGAKDPLDLVGEAVAWLKGQAPYTYSDGSTGKVDTGVTPDGFLSGAEYNTSTKAFTFDANGGKAGTALTSNLEAWQKNVDVFDVGNVENPASIVVMANGEDLKNALESFNQGKLITSADGTLVGWSNDGGLTMTDVNDNLMDNFWLTLSGATSWV